MTPLALIQDLKDAVATVPRLKGYMVDEVVQPPGVVFYPPELRTMTSEPSLSTAVFEAYLIVKANEPKPWRTLLQFVGQVTDAIEQETEAVVISAEPGTFAGAATSGELPAYRLLIEAPTY